MQTDIHPRYSETNVRCSCGNTFTTGQPRGGELHIELCNECHPFFTGKQKLVDSAAASSASTSATALARWPRPRTIDVDAVIGVEDRDRRSRLPRAQAGGSRQRASGSRDQADPRHVPAGRRPDDRRRHRLDPARGGSGPRARSGPAWAVRPRRGRIERPGVARYRCSRPAPSTDPLPSSYGTSRSEPCCLRSPSRPLPTSTRVPPTSPSSRSSSRRVLNRSSSTGSSPATCVASRCVASSTTRRRVRSAWRSASEPTIARRSPSCTAMCPPLTHWQLWSPPSPPIARQARRAITRSTAWARERLLRWQLEQDPALRRTGRTSCRPSRRCRLS